MKVLVTGATGFVGGHLVERLLKESLQVTCLVRPSAEVGFLRTLPVTVCASQMEDAAELARAVAGSEIVYHVAGLTRARTLKEYLAVNAELTGRLVRAAMDAGGVRRFVYVSSLAAVGPNPGEEAMDETVPPRPRDFYGESKLAGERVCLAVRDRLPVTIVRPPAVYGPRDPNFVPVFRMAQRLGIVPAIGGRNKLISFVHAADLAEGIYLASMGAAGVGQTYFVGSGTHTMAEVTAAIGGALGRRLRLVRIPKVVAWLAGEWGQLKWALTGRPQLMSRRKVRDLGRPRWTCSWEKARRELGYQERVGLAEGMRETAAWYAREGLIKAVRAEHLRGCV